MVEVNTLVIVASRLFLKGHSSKDREITRTITTYMSPCGLRGWKMAILILPLLITHSVQKYFFHQTHCSHWNRNFLHLHVYSKLTNEYIFRRETIP